uniref:Uncharacterized protein n=1 Tax=Anguilla anguilla TaxID=7936 RepID=A0A0E9QML2_ANGAN
MQTPYKTHASIGLFFFCHLVESVMWQWI